jgi:tetratricopeptide (TPR) repeat protein
MVDGIDELERGRECASRRAWVGACSSLSDADRACPLGPDDLELLATSSYMLGREDEHVSALERAHHAHLDAGEVLRAARCAFWVGINLALRGEMGPAAGWFGRAQRLVERDGHDCVERGYLLVPLLVRQLASGDEQAACATSATAAEIGERFGDADLLALAVYHEGHSLIRLDRAEEGLGLLSEAMVAVVAGELSPIVTGLIYCSVLEACQEAYALRHAREWTAALTRWCEQQSDMVAFTGKCLVHRAEIMQLDGAWRDALWEARRACERLLQDNDQRAAAQAFYRQGEILRLQGQFAGAQDAYSDASRWGWDPQPGLALLQLAQGNRKRAAATIRRAVGETTNRMSRVALLPAYVEIMLAVGDVQEAGSACRELAEISKGHERRILGAIAAQAQGTVELADGNAQAALIHLRDAEQVWQELEAPYEVARVRVLVGLACRALGDDDTAARELTVALGLFEQLGARPDIARVAPLGQQASPRVHGLTAREQQVLRMVASGKTNHEIAAEPSSASTPSPATSKTSSSSSVFHRARPRARLRSSTISSNPPPG